MMPKLSIESRVVSIYPNKEATKKSSAGMEHKTAMEYKLELDKLEKLRLQSHKAGKPFVKRSSLLPWNTTKQHTAPGVPSQAKFVSSQTVKPSPQPARVASDVTAAAAVPVQSQDGSVTRKANLSTSEKIAALQEDWERRHLGGSENRSLTSKSRPNSTSATPVPLPSYAAPPKRPGDAKREPRPKRRHTDSPSVVYSVAEKDIYDFDSADSESRKKEDLETTEHLPNNVKKVPNDMKIHSGPKKQSHKRRKLNLWGDDERDWHSSKKSEEEKLAEALSMYEGDFIPQTWEQFELTASMRRTIYQDVEVGEKRVAVITQYGDGLLYQHYTGEDGKRRDGGGGVLPEGYSPLSTNEAKWVCPIRDCRQRHDTVKGNGVHFKAVHNKAALNDNLDGTFSVVGFYRSNKLYCPAVVVSRNPLPPGAPPPVESTLSYGVLQNRKALGSLSKPATYLKTLSAEFQTVPHRDDIMYMLRMPRLRNLPNSWINYHKGLLLHPQHYACALAYIVGEEIDPTDPEFCTQVNNKFKPTLRLSKKCIRVPQRMPDVYKLQFSSCFTCVGCRYWSHLQHQTNQCDWNNEPKNHKPRRKSKDNNESLFEPERNSVSSTAPLAPHTRPKPVVRAASLSDEESQTQTMSKLRASKPEPEPPKSQSIRFRIEESSDEEPCALSIKAIESSMIDAPASRLRAPDFEPPKRSSSRLHKFKSPDTVRDEIRDELASKTNDHQSTDRMEDWEFAPGRVQSTSSRETIAFSSIYLTATQPITIADDIAFHRLRIPPGGMHTWTPVDNKLRYCEVISGKVELKMGGQQVAIGDGGMFIMRPGMGCVVENRTYGEAVLSCHTNANYSLTEE